MIATPRRQSHDGHRNSRSFGNRFVGDLCDALFGGTLVGGDSAHGVYDSSPTNIFIFYFCT